MTVNDTKIAADGTVTVTFTLTDGADLPLDRSGLYTEGAVTPRFVLAWLDEAADGTAAQYTAYTTKDQKSPITMNTATQAATDEGGTFADVDLDKGISTYTFKTKVDVKNPDKTHTLGVWASRPFKGQTYSTNVIYDFVPSGAAVKTRRDVVETASCNSCHGTLEAHGGVRRETSLCVLCHSPQTTDPDTGNTVDFAVMVHKIHRGENLPSVKAGTPYQIIGYMQSVNDYSTVAYPQPLQNCNSCHKGTQADNWKNRPSMIACSSCHDQVSFVDPPPAGKILHTGGVQLDNSKCSVCHPPAGGLEGIETKHLTPASDPASPKLTFNLKSATKTGPGQTPEIVFDVAQNGAALDILATPLPRLAVTIAGPTTDYASFTSYTIQGSGSKGTLTAEPGGGFRYVFPAPIDPAATGSIGIGLEGYLQPGGAAGPRLSAPNVVLFAPVTDAAAVPRHEVVDTKLCNGCHENLGAHGGQRNDTQYCVFCHNPNNVNDERVSRPEGQTVTANSVDLKVMIHRIHMGEALDAAGYTLGGFPAPSKANPAGTVMNFGETRYPGDRKACWSCHKADTYMLPIEGPARLPSMTQDLQCTEDPAADADSYCDTRVVASTTLYYPESAACTGCHNAPAAIAHTQLNTTQSGVEACATCHGKGAAYDVQLMHQPAP
jgi:OmcA/MtrC family decaheme c-type cytochrome